MQKPQIFLVNLLPSINTTNNCYKNTFCETSSIIACMAVVSCNIVAYNLALVSFFNKVFPYGTSVICIVRHDLSVTILCGFFLLQLKLNQFHG